MKEIDPVALFRLSVLGPIVSRERLLHGELQQLMRELCLREYAIPGSQRRVLGEKTIQAWFYAWRRDGIAGLTPKVRADLGQSKIAPAIQEAILAAKGKLERWHRTFRDQFLSELDERRINDLNDLNARLWSWLEQIYHHTAHAGLGGLTPLARYQRDLPRIRSLGTKAAQLDALFLHRVARFVRKDGTVSYLGQRFEVPYELSGKTVRLVVDPHAQRVVGVENEAGVSLGAVTPLDMLANIQRVRRKPEPPPSSMTPHSGPNLVELAHAQYHALQLPAKSEL